MTYLEEIKAILADLKPTLTKDFHVNEVGLFGSITRSDFSKTDSDIDIIVDFKKPIGIEFINLADLLETTLKRKVDLVSKKGIKQKYLQAIQQDIVYV